MCEHNLSRDLFVETLQMHRDDNFIGVTIELRRQRVDYPKLPNMHNAHTYILNTLPFSICVYIYTFAYAFVCLFVANLVAEGEKRG